MIFWVLACELSLVGLHLPVAHDPGKICFVIVQYRTRAEYSIPQAEWGVIVAKNCLTLVSNAKVACSVGLWDGGAGRGT
jgi:hypothetical protein